eukprot:GHRR01000626.1.p1 GENE.GHRR01000626.1~~GHRR01000626.1.p1  ORF type:complete len:336 (+),score=76.84 GHRR01000626.1:214-1221(+)
MYLMMGVTLVLAFLCHTAHTDGEQLPGGAAANGAKGNTTTNKQPATCVQDPADWPAAAAILAAVQGKTGRKLNQNLQTQQQTQPQTQLSNAPVTVNGHSGATSDTQSPAGQQAYCIPTTPGDTFNVLCAGDSLTLGAVPSLCEKHPYSIKLTQLLQARLGDGAKAVTAGLGGGGIYVNGSKYPVTFAPFFLDQLLNHGPWNVVVIMVGINDLGKGASADAVMAGLQPIVTRALSAGDPVFWIPPLPAPGFVTNTREAERKKLAGLILDEASQWADSTQGKGPQIYVLDLESGPLDFTQLSAADQSIWLDDGLHLTEYAYDQLGEYVYDAIASHLC